MKTFYVGIKGIIIDKDQGALLLRRDQESGVFWDIPGGRMDNDEDFIETLQRELSEELPGSEVEKVGDLLGSYRLHKDIDGEISLVLLYFAVTAKLPDPIQLSEEHDGSLWVKTVDQIPDGLNDVAAGILRKALTALASS